MPARLKLQDLHRYRLWSTLRLSPQTRSLYLSGRTRFNWWQHSPFLLLNAPVHALCILHLSTSRPLAFTLTIHLSRTDLDPSVSSLPPPSYESAPAIFR